MGQHPNTSHHLTICQSHWFMAIIRPKFARLFSLMGLIPPARPTTQHITMQYTTLQYSAVLAEPRTRKSTTQIHHNTLMLLGRGLQKHGNAGVAIRKRHYGISVRCVKSKTFGYHGGSCHNVWQKKKEQQQRGYRSNTKLAPDHARLPCPSKHECEDLMTGQAVVRSTSESRRASLFGFDASRTNAAVDCISRRDPPYDRSTGSPAVRSISYTLQSRVWGGRMSLEREHPRSV